MGHTEDCDPEFGCDEKCTAPLPPECTEPAPISSPRCDAWRDAVDSDRAHQLVNGPATEVRCVWAAGHPLPHYAHGIQW